MTLPVGIDPTTVALFVGGIIGGILRATMGKHPTLSKRTLNDIIVGGAVAGVSPLFLPVTIPPTASLFLLALLGLILGTSGSYLLTWAAWKLGIYKDDPRPTLPNGSNGEHA